MNSKVRVINTKAHTLSLTPSSYFSLSLYLSHPLFPLSPSLFSFSFSCSIFYLAFAWRRHSERLGGNQGSLNDDKLRDIKMCVCVWEREREREREEKPNAAQVITEMQKQNDWKLHRPSDQISARKTLAPDDDECWTKWPDLSKIQILIKPQVGSSIV